jgi:hypothetical protein
MQDYHLVFGVFLFSKIMKNLELEFIGKGQVKGFIFKQIDSNEKCFIYEVNTGNSLHYEVFNRKENTQFNCISYPSDKAFGLWAFCFKSKESALNKFNELMFKNHE